MKVVQCPVPPWFSGSEILIQLIFAFVTLFVAYYAYRVYTVSSQRSIAWFSIGFLGVSASYFVQAILNFLVLRGVQSSQIVSALSGGAVQQSIPLSIVAIVTHMLLMTLSFGVLAYVTLKERGLKPLLLIWSLSLVALAFARDFVVAFYIIISILLLFMTAQHYQRLEKRRSVSSLLVFMGFGLILLGMMQIGLATSLNLMYISGHFILLVGYLLLLWSLFRVVSHE